MDKLEVCIKQWFGFVVHDLGQFVIIVGTIYLIVNVVMASILKNREIQKQKIGAKQLMREVLFSIVTVCIFSGMGWLVHFGPLRPFTLLYTDLDVYSFGVAGLEWAYLVFSLSLAILLHDAYFYWVHRTMHHPAIYRYVHRLHHRSVTPCPTTAYAFAPGEAVLNALFLPLLLFVIPMHPITIGLFTMVMIARNTLAHTGIEVFPAGFVSGPFGWSTTVTHHDLHHLHGVGNYGFYFTWWDRLMGTERVDYETRFRQTTEMGVPFVERVEEEVETA